MQPSVQYPRTLHLPWSDTIGDDGDHVLEDLSGFDNQEVVLAEKLDGENTTLYLTHLHLPKGHPARWMAGTMLRATGSSRGKRARLT